MIKQSPNIRLAEIIVTIQAKAQAKAKEKSVGLSRLNRDRNAGMATILRIIGPAGIRPRRITLLMKGLD